MPGVFRSLLGCALLAAGCSGVVAQQAGGGTTSGAPTGGTATTTTATTSTGSGIGGEPPWIDAGPVGDAGGPDTGPVADAAAPATCPPPPSPLPDGMNGPPSCDCLCGVEAPKNLLMLANAAVAAYKSGGVLCKAPGYTVPGFVPPGVCYGPSWHGGDINHQDFFSGDSTTGWTCLGVGPALTDPIHCRYGYNVGTGYFGPALGGPDPGPMGFEVVAQGDFDDDGVYSTFTIAATFDPVQGEFTLSPVFQHDPTE